MIRVDVILKFVGHSIRKLTCNLQNIET